MGKYESSIPHWGPPSAGQDDTATVIQPMIGAVSPTTSKGDVYYYHKVDDTNILHLNKEIQVAAANAKQTAFEYSLAEAPPIHLHIHSYGGSVFAGFAAVGTLLNCGVPVHTYIEGGVASAGTFLSIVGTKRFMYKHSYILIHQLSSGMWGKYSEFKDEMQNLNALMETIKKLYKEYTKIPDKVLVDLLSHDLWLDADTALEYGLIDEII